MLAVPFSSLGRLSAFRLALTIGLIGLGATLFASSIRFRAMWRDDPATTMVIGWDQVSGEEPVFYYDLKPHGKRAEAYAFSRLPDRIVRFRGMNNHFVRLTGLQPDTEYHFIVVDSEGSTRRMSFRTTPSHPGAPLSIAAGGDSRNHRTARRLANLLVAKLRPHFVMFGGDFTGGDTAGEWQLWMDDWQETIALDGRLTPIVATRGNHEYSNETLHKLFDLPSEKGYYALSFGGNLLRVYTLNSMTAPGGRQRDWLEKDLHQHLNAIWRIAQYHHSMRPHTIGKKEKTDLVEEWAWLFFRYGLRLVVESDSHVVKTTWPIRPSNGPDSEEGFVQDNELGTVYVGEGCWGAPLRASNDEKSWTRGSGSFNQFKWILVRAEGIEVRTLATDGAEQVIRNNDKNRLIPPMGLLMWDPGNGAVVRIPRTKTKYPLSPVRAPQEIGPSVARFTATSRGEGVELQWSAKQLPAGTVFELHRSLDGGKSFEVIGTQPSSIDQQSSYRLIDPIRPSSSSGVQYRLQYTDPAGSPVWIHSGLTNDPGSNR